MRGSDDHDRFRALYERHYAAVLRYAARRVGAEAAADVAAETFLTAWRRLDVVLAREPLPWLYATARWCLANELRSRGSRERLDARLRAEASAGQGVAYPGLAESVASRLDVLAALAVLSEGDQEALRLTEWEELDDATAARVVGCSTTAFKVRVHRARRRLARALDRQAATSASPAAASANRMEIHR